MTLHISDHAEEFRIEILGPFVDSAVDDAKTAWRAALRANNPRRISVDITGMTYYDHEGYCLLRQMHIHGTLIAAGTPGSLEFLNQISGPALKSSEVTGYDGVRVDRRPSGRRVLTMQARAAASGE